MKFLALLILIFTSVNLCHGELCGYVPAPTRQNQSPELTPATDCGTLIDKDTLVVDARLLGKIDFDENGLADVRFNNGSVFYVSESGKTARTIYFDNGPDSFVEGLARTLKNKKIGFVDKELNVVIAPQYDFASPFQGGIAQVCNGCVRKYSGEHWEMVGGEWGEIDKIGNLVTPLRQHD